MDISTAFDKFKQKQIARDTQNTFLDDDEVRMIRCLTDQHLPQSEKFFERNIGSPQGDSLALFTIVNYGHVALLRTKCLRTQNLSGLEARAFGTLDII